MPEPRAFSFRLGEELAAAFAKYQVEYLFIGKAGAIFYGFPDTTQDADIFPLKSPENGQRIASALRDLGFTVDPAQEAELVRGKDFVQVRDGPFDVDLVFAPDGIETFAVRRSQTAFDPRRWAVPRREPRRHHQEQEGREPPKRPRVSAAVGSLPSIPAGKRLRQSAFPAGTNCPLAALEAHPMLLASAPVWPHAGAQKIRGEKDNGNHNDRKCRARCGGSILGSTQVLSLAARFHWLLSATKPTMTLDVFVPF